MNLPYTFPSSYQVSTKAASCFDTEWKLSNSCSTPPRHAKIALLKFCNDSGFCLLIKLDRFKKMSPALIEFLAVRDIKFVGFNISKELEKLKEDFALEIRTMVELTSFAAHKWPVVSKSDACWILCDGIGALWEYSTGYKPKGVDEETMFWLANNPWGDFGENSSSKQLEYAVFSAYAAVKIANKLRDVDIASKMTNISQALGY